MREYEKIRQNSNKIRENLEESEEIWKNLTKFRENTTDSERILTIWKNPRESKRFRKKFKRIWENHKQYVKRIRKNMKRNRKNLTNFLWIRKNPENPKNPKNFSESGTIRKRSESIAQNLKKFETRENLKEYEKSLEGYERIRRNCEKN
mgnify:CR=1 FL=1